MNELFPISELAIAAVFVSGLLWLVLDVARHHPRDALVMIADPERFARMMPQAHRLQGRAQLQPRTSHFRAAAAC